MRVVVCVVVVVGSECTAFRILFEVILVPRWSRTNIVGTCMLAREVTSLFFALLSAKKALEVTVKQHKDEYSNNIKAK